MDVFITYVNQNHTYVVNFYFFLRSLPMFSAIKYRNEILDINGVYADASN